MQSLSAVIVCKNEAGIIGSTLESLRGLTDDIVVYDSGSTDGTQELVRKFGARLFEGSWEGFGKTKKKAAMLAKYDWVLALDSDESIDDTLKNNLLAWKPQNERTVYKIPFRNFLGSKYLRYGEWGGDSHIRLFNRRVVNWNEDEVHEQLSMDNGITVKKLKGHILHRTMKDMEDYSAKMDNYAMLNAEKYYRMGKRSSWFRIRLSPVFTFLNYYLLKLGFLDGHAGYVCAKMTAHYTFLKYARLKELWKIGNRK